MIEKTKVHFAWNEVKTSIIKFVLESSGPVTEPAIRERLLDIYGAADQGLINRQLHTLKSSGCIEKISPAKKSRLNYWDITKLKNLRNIRLHFAEIQLNTYMKSANIFLETYYNQGTPFAISFRNQLLLSSSFFDMCIKTDIKTLEAKFDEIYQLGDGFEEEQDFKKLITEVRIEWVKRMPIYFVATTEFGANICLPKEVFEISDDAFRKMFNNISAGVPREEVVEIIYSKMMQEIHYNINKKMLVINLPIPKGELDKPSFDILSKPEMFPEEIIKNTAEIKRIIWRRNIARPNQMFEHFFERDIIADICSPLEREYVRDVKKESAYFKPGDPMSAYLKRIEFYNAWYEKIIDYYEKYRDKPRDEPDM